MSYEDIKSMLRAPGRTYTKKKLELIDKELTKKTPIESAGEGV